MRPAPTNRSRNRSWRSMMATARGHRTIPHGPWRLAHAKAVKIALPDAFFDSLGLPRLVVTERLNPPNRRMRTRMSGGVAGARG